MIVRKGKLLVYEETGEIYEPIFSNYSNPLDYYKAKVIPIEPMTAKEEDREKELEIMLAPNSGYYAEEKFDGTRATMHIGKDHTRIFSRRISKKTDWYTENTDSLPQMRSIASESLDGTILDGEMFIPDRPFKDVSSTLNCNWDKAIDRQMKLGWIVLHAFDIIYYRGVYVAKMPLWKRKNLLRQVCKELKSKYVKEVNYYDDDIDTWLDEEAIEHIKDHKEIYPSLYKDLKYALDITDYDDILYLHISKRAYYEYIILKGGEGIILKNKNGKYYHKRGREYTKMKKFLTRDCIITGFTPPTPEYEGKFPTPEKWRYWESNEKDLYDTSHPKQLKVVKASIEECAPISKFYYEGWVGNITFGVIATDEIVEQLKKTKKEVIIDGHVQGNPILRVGECAGFNEEQRKYFTEHRVELVGQVVEILANEIFNDTGKLRHPRYLRLRPDKSPEMCTWKDHIGG